MIRLSKYSVLFFAIISISAFAQTWERADKSDPTSNTNITEFTLKGKFLVSPRNTNEGGAPQLVLRCQQGQHVSRGHIFNGRFLDGYLSTGVVLLSTVYEEEGMMQRNVTPVSYRLDGHTLKSEYWTLGTDHDSAFFEEATLDNLLYGHSAPHKEDTNPPVRQLFLGLKLHSNAELQMQFDMPDSQQVADVCGVTYHNKK